MDRRGGGDAGGSSLQVRSAWSAPLHQTGKMAMKSPALSFNSQVQQNPPCRSSVDDSDGGAGYNVDSLESSIMADYPSTEDMEDTGVVKIRSFLLASRSGATSCLICLERVRATDPVWDCKFGCHQIFHLICIQSWACQAIGAAAIRSLGLSCQHFPTAQAEPEDEACWHYPKCRTDYEKTELPGE